MEQNESNAPTNNSHQSVTCPSCGSAATSSRTEEELFQYGEEPAAEMLTANVTVYACSKCGDEFLDAQADDARHEAICRHLGVLTPLQIRALRTRYDMSRAEFCRVTKLGEATLARWERGALVQNTAYDRFLYLLSFRENMDRLRISDHPLLHGLESGRTVEAKFRCLNPTPDDREIARSFKLTEAA